MKRFKFIIPICVILLAFTSDHSSKYPQDYFRLPVDHSILLSGTFGELRSNHFHAGIDIKPKYGVGEKLYAVADGYVSRIMVSPRSYGKALYIDHPNGYTSVYAHLYNFNDSLATYVKNEQYAREQFAFNLYPEAGRLPVKKGEIIGYLGNSGRSFGAHLHFEIRHTESEVPINPLLFGLKVKDNIPPQLRQLKTYALNSDMTSIEEKVFTIRKGRNNHYISKDTLEVVTSYLGLGVKTYDLLNGASNLNGVYRLTVQQDSTVIYQFNMEAISFDETRYINAHTDYAAWRKDKSRFNRCFVFPGNHLSIYENVVNNGLISLSPGQTSRITVTSEDLAGNASTLILHARQSDADLPDFDGQTFNYVLPYGEPSIIQTNDLQLSFKPGSFYRDAYLLYDKSVEISDGYYSSIHHIGDPDVPVHHPFELRIKPSNLPAGLEEKALVARCYGNNKPVSIGGTWEDGYMMATTNKLGDYCIILDTLPPSVTPLKVSSVMNKGYRMSFRISDELAGIGSYNGWVDDQWILMEYDEKNKFLFHKFDGRVPSGKHEFKLVVKDRSGNETRYEKSFSTN